MIKNIIKYIVFDILFSSINDVIIDEILNEVFPADITEIINQQEYLGMRLSGGIDSALTFALAYKALMEKAAEKHSTLPSVSTAS